MQDRFQYVYLQFLTKTATIDIKGPADHYRGAGKDINIITSSLKLYTDK